MPFFEVLPVVAEDLQLPSIDEFVEAQKVDSLCGRLTATVGEPGTQFNIDENGKLLRRATTDGLLQKVLPARLRPAVLYYALNPVYPGHPGCREMYSTLRMV